MEKSWWYHGEWSALKSPAAKIHWGLRPLGFGLLTSQGTPFTTSDFPNNVPVFCKVLHVHPTVGLQCTIVSCCTIVCTEVCTVECTVECTDECTVVCTVVCTVGELRSIHAVLASSLCDTVVKRIVGNVVRYCSAL